MPDNAAPGTKPATPCPICRRKPLPEFHPFCSARCADVDLGRWFTGTYRVPGPPEEPETGEDEP